MANKITQKQRFEALIELVKANGITVANGEVTEGTEDIVKFLESRIEALDKKVSKSNDKISTEQTEVDEKVLSVMTADKRKVAEIVKAVNPEYGVEYSSSRVTASLGRLKGKGEVINEIEKKNSYYRLAD